MSTVDNEELQLPDAQELETLEALAVELAVEAGRLIRDGRPDALGVARTKATDLDVVTAMDQASEALLGERLAELRPDDAILGEEGGVSPGTSGLTWVLDPIDGTVNYLYELPGYAVSVAVVLGDPTVPGGWRPVAGAVSVPATGDLFHARLGGGAWLEQGLLGPHGGDTLTRRLTCSQVEDLGMALLATGFSYSREARQVQAAVVADLIPRVRDVRRLGAAAVDLCHVAAGRVDGYWESGCRPWDLAAGILVVTEAGGTVTGRTPGSAASEDVVVAAGPGVQDTLRAEVERLEGAFLG